MTNGPHKLSCREEFVFGGTRWVPFSDDTIRACLVKRGYEPSMEDRFFSDLAGNVVGDNEGMARADCPEVTVNSRGCAAGTIRGVLGSAAFGDYVAIFKDSGADDTSPLLILFAFSWIGGIDIAFQWEYEAMKLFTE